MPYKQISIEKTKVWILEGEEPVRTKIVNNNTTFEQVIAFNYLGKHLCLLLTSEDDNNKMHRFQILLGSPKEN